MIAIIGDGYVAQVLKKHLGHHAQIIVGKFSTLGDLRDALTPLRPSAVVNAAHKGSPASMQRFDMYSREWNEHALVNVLLPEWMAMLASELKYKFIHFSTLMVLDDWYGDYDKEDREKRGYSEVMCQYGRSPEFSNYARMKRMAEARLMGNSLDVPCDQYRTLVLRIHLPISGIDHSRNPLLRFIKFRELATEEVSITNLDELAQRLPSLINPWSSGLLHVVNEGVISPFQIGQMLSVSGMREYPESTTLKAINEKREGAYQPRVVACSESWRFLASKVPPLTPVVDSVAAAIDTLKASLE